MIMKRKRNSVGELNTKKSKRDSTPSVEFVKEGLGEQGLVQNESKGDGYESERSGFEEETLSRTDKDTEVYKAESFFDALSTQSRPVSELRLFVSQAQRHQEGLSKYNIVENYLCLTTNCTELVYFLRTENNSSDTKLASALHRAMTCILEYIATALDEKWEVMGTELVKKILQMSMKGIYEMMNTSVDIMPIGSSLKLLTAMVMIDPKSVVANIDFSHQSFRRLMNWKPAKKPLYLRKFMMNFILSFLIVGDRHIVQKVVSLKLFLNSFFAGLSKDRSIVIVKFLTVLKEKVIENLAAVSKTLKIRLLNNSTLGPVVELLDWTGPFKQNKAHQKNYKELDASEKIFATPEEIEEVRKVALEFLRSACCSYRFGIIFKEVSTKGTQRGARNANHMLTILLKEMKQPLESELKMEFITEVLRTCPDQRRHFWSNIKSSFQPRLSPIWIRAMDFLIKVLKSDEMSHDQHIYQDFAGTQGLHIFRQAEIVEALKSNHSLVRLKILEWMLLVLKRVESVVNHSQMSNHRKRDHIAFKFPLYGLLLKALPKLQVVSACLTEPFESLDLQASEDKKASMSSYLGACVEVLMGYVGVLPQTSLPIDFPFESLFARIQEELPPGERSPIFINLLKLVSHTDMAQTLFQTQEGNKSNVVNQLVQLLRDKSVEKSAVLEILYSLLEKHGVVVKSLELDLWLDHLEGPDCLSLVCSALFLLVKNFNTFQDQVTENRLTIHKHEQQKSSLTFKELCKLYKVTSAQDTSESPRGLSAFIPAILMALKENTINRNACTEYIEGVLCDILHTCSNPRSLCLLIEELFEEMSPIFRDYISLWTKTKVVVMTGSRYEEHESPSLSLRSAFLELQRDPKKKTRFHKIPSDHSLIPQTLLYIDHQLQKILDGSEKDSKGAEALIRFLQGLVQIEVSEKDENSDYEIETGPVKTLEYIFRQGVSLKWFLWLEELLEDDPVIEPLKTLWTRTILVYSKHLPRNTDLLAPFKVKVLRYVEHLCSKRTQSKFLWGQVLRPLKMICGVLWAEDCVKALNEISVGVLSKPVCSLSYVFVSRLVELEVDHKSAITPRSIDSLFRSVWLRPDNKLVKGNNPLPQIFISLLKKYTLYSLSVPIDVALKILDKGNEVCYKTMKLLIERSPAHKEALRGWIEESPSKLTLFLPSAVLEILSVFASSNEDDPLLPRFANHVLSALATLISEECQPTDNIEGLIRVMARKEMFDKLALNSVVQEVVKAKEGILPDVHQFDILLQFFRGLRGSKFEGQRQAMSKLFFSWLPELISNLRLFQIFSGKITFDESEDGFALPDEIDLKGICMSLLESCLKDDSVVLFLCCLCKRTYSSASLIKVESPKAAELLELLFAQPDFLEVMENRNATHTALRDAVLDLLIILMSSDGSFCNSDQVPLLLSSYHATMDTTDQKILYLLGLYESNNVRLAQYRPFHWGQSAALKYSESSAPYLKDSNDVFEELNESRMITTIKYFPLDLSLKVDKPKDYLWEDCVTGGQVYDLRFLLPLFISLLDQGSYVDCLRFIRCECLNLVISCLASQEADTRGAAYTILARFYQQLESSIFPDREVFIQLIKGLRNAIPVDNSRVSSIITTFIAKCVQVIGNPGAPMYPILSHYLFSSEALQITHVPEFKKLFYSTNNMLHKTYKSFILEVLSMGFRSSLDFHLSHKSYIFNDILLFTASNASTLHSREECMNFVVRVLRVRAGAFSLYRDHSFLSWISSVLTKNESESFLALVVTAMHSLWKTSLQTKDGLEKKKTHPFGVAFPLQFITVQLVILNRLKKTEYYVTLGTYLWTLGEALAYHVKFEGCLSVVPGPSHIADLVEIMSRMDSQEESPRRCLWAARRLVLLWSPGNRPCRPLKPILKQVLSIAPVLCGAAARWLRHLSCLQISLAQDLRSDPTLSRLLLARYSLVADREVLLDTTIALLNFAGKQDEASKLESEIPSDLELNYLIALIFDLWQEKPAPKLKPQIVHQSLTLTCV